MTTNAHPESRISEPLERELRELVRELGPTMKIDLEAYEAAGLEWWQPVLLGSGSLQSRVGLFGRDPGRNELFHREPFIGKAGQQIRDGLHRARHGTPCPSIDASLVVGSEIFWGNTVPFKPIGNKAWSVKVKRAFAPLITRLLCEEWQGDELITCGREAFLWFALADKSLKPAIEEHWALDDRFGRSLEVTLAGKRLRLHPLPHPSPLNARWYKLFPGLLDGRLKELGWPER